MTLWSHVGVKCQSFGIYLFIYLLSCLTAQVSGSLLNLGHSSGGRQEGPTWYQRAAQGFVRRPYLCVKGATWVAEVVGAAEDKPRKNFFLLDAFQPQLEILSRTSVIRLHIVAQQAQNLHRVLQDRPITTRWKGNETYSILKTKATCGNEVFLFHYMLLLNHRCPVDKMKPWSSFLLIVFFAVALGHNRGNLTLFGIMTNCWALLMDPDSSFPRITVPMSWRERNSPIHCLFRSLKMKHTWDSWIDTVCYLNFFKVTFVIK